MDIDIIGSDSKVVAREKKNGFLYTRQELIEKMQRSNVFETGYDIQNIMSAIGTYSIGCVLVAAPLVGVHLTGEQIDTLYHA